MIHLNSQSVSLVSHGNAMAMHIYIETQPNNTNAKKQTKENLFHLIVLAGVNVSISQRHNALPSCGIAA